MNEPEFTPQEQELINRLANAPQPSLNPAAFEWIRVRMLDGLDTPPLDVSPRLQPLWPSPISVPRVAALAAVVIVVLGILMLLNRSSELIILTTVPPTAVPMVTTIPPTASLQAEVIVTVEASPTPPPVITPEQIATATLEPVIVVEGPVESIEGNVITIYGITIALNPDDPLLSVLVVGDMLRVEADYAEDVTLIIAVTVEPLTNDVNVNPDTGEAWRDEGGCNNPPPDWAPANGWRRRCQGASGNANPPGNGNGKGNNDDNDDDNDD